MPEIAESDNGLLDEEPWDQPIPSIETVTLQSDSVTKAAKFGTNSSNQEEAVSRPSSSLALEIHSRLEAEASELGNNYSDGNDLGWSAFILKASPKPISHARSSLKTPATPSSKRQRDGKLSFFSLLFTISIFPFHNEITNDDNNSNRDSRPPFRPPEKKVSINYWEGKYRQCRYRYRYKYKYRDRTRN